MRLDPKDRTNELLDVALQIAERTGWRNLTHASVAAAAGVSNGLVVARLGTKQEMLRAVMRRAVNRGVVPVVAFSGKVASTPATRFWSSTARRWMTSFPSFSLPSAPATWCSSPAAISVAS